MRSLERALIHYDWCPYKRRNTLCKNRHTQGEHHVMSEAETRVIHLQVQECQGLKAITRSWEEGRKESTQSLRGSMVQLMPWLQSSTLQTMREQISAALSHPICGTLPQQPQEAKTLLDTNWCTYSRLNMYQVLYCFILMITFICYHNLLRQRNKITLYYTTLLSLH